MPSDVFILNHESPVLNRIARFFGFGSLLKQIVTLINELKTVVNQIRSTIIGDYLDSYPALAIGTTKPNVAYDAFNFHEDGVLYLMAALAAGVALPAQTCPQNKYAAYRFEVGANKTVDVIAATDNGTTGYDSAVLALAGLAALQADHVSLGTLTVTSSGAGGFVAATTDLDDGAVTTIYTDAIPPAGGGIGAAVTSTTVRTISG